MRPEIPSGIKYLDFSPIVLTETLGLSRPPFLPSDPFRQLNFIHDHVDALGCKTIILEPHYIDRHYIEDHSIFYSRNFTPLRNYCQRLHFFNMTKSQVKKKITSIVKIGRAKGRSAYKRACAKFSEEAYLGFCVVKPLDGSPVGRTVLRYYEEKADGTLRRVFSSTRKYKAHVAGCELKVLGLAFQQQDVGVSACATTALWSSLQQSRQFEEIRPATPAQITMLASQNALPFGKPMPSEGLSVEQMCQATQLLGVPPTLIRVRENYEDAMGHLHSITLSGFAPVLIMELVGNSDINHAVTVTGIKVDAAFDANSIPGIDVDKASEMRAVYIHDDRFGPYVRADIDQENSSLYFDIDYKGKYKNERWLLTHILTPMHPKIRLSFAGLRRITKKIVLECGKELKSLSPATSLGSFTKIVYQIKIQRSVDYVEDLIYDNHGLAANKLEKIFSELPLSRYVGIIRLESESFGQFDVLIDTTSTVHNLHYLGVLFTGEHRPHTNNMRDWLAEKCGGPIV